MFSYILYRNISVILLLHFLNDTLSYLTHILGSRLQFLRYFPLGKTLKNQRKYTMLFVVESSCQILNDLF